MKLQYKTISEMAPHVIRDLVVSNLIKNKIPIKRRVSSKESNSEYLTVDVGDTKDEFGEKTGDKLLKVRVSDHPSRQYGVLKYGKADVEVGPHGMDWKKAVSHIIKHTQTIKEEKEQIIYRLLSNYSLGQYVRHGDKQAEWERDRRQKIFDMMKSYYNTSPSERKPEDQPLHPDVIDVEGTDEWNKQKAKELEQKYLEAKPKLEKLLDNVIGQIKDIANSKKPTSDVVIKEDPTELSELDDEQTFNKWKDNNFDEYFNSEVENWHSNGDAMADAYYTVTNDNVWKEETLRDLLDERKEEELPDFPYSHEDLLSAIELDSHEDNFSIKFDDDALKYPIDFDPAQYELPGIEPMDQSKKLTKEMREYIKSYFAERIESKAEDLINSGVISPPEYLKDTTLESLESVWSDKTDQEKIEIAKEVGVIEVEHDEGEEYINSIGFTDSDLFAAEKRKELENYNPLPKIWDPLQETFDDKLEDEEEAKSYKKTRILMHKLWYERANQLLEEKGLKPKGDYLKEIDSDMWGEWKSSSCSLLGQAIQYAAAEWLGGRVRETKKFAIRPEDYYNLDDIKKIFTDEQATRSDVIRIVHEGGWETFKLLIQAKWEVTQFALEKAGVNELAVYRACIIKYGDSALAGKKFMPGEKNVDIHIDRNGAASFSTKVHIPNDWNGSDGRRVIRAIVPRTAILSVPAYGQNIHAEKEVVVAGTAWKYWDVYDYHAPDFEKAPPFKLLKEGISYKTVGKKIHLDVGLADFDNYKHMHWLWFTGSKRRNEIQKKHRDKWMNKKNWKKTVKKKVRGKK